MVKKLIAYIVKSIVEEPHEVSVAESLPDEDNATIFEISVANRDRGKVIGKEGKTIRSLRMVARAFSEGKETRVVLAGEAQNP